MKVKEVLKNAFSAFALALFLFAVVFFVVVEIRRGPEVLPDGPPVASVIAEDLWEEYHADRGAADSRYAGKWVEVTGVVNLVKKRHVHFYPARRSTHWTIEAEFDQDVDGVQLDQLLTVQGIPKRKQTLVHVVLKHAKIVPTNLNLR